MRKVLVMEVIIILILLFTSITYAFAEISGDYEYIILEDNTICITDWFGTESSIIIPELIDGFTVTEIGVSAFEGKNISYVYMPNSIIKLGKRAFSSCYNLTYVELSDEISVIPEGAFSFSNLSSVKYPKNLKRIENSAFCATHLLSAVLPEGIEEIGDSSFALVNLNEIQIPSTLKKIGKQAFSCINPVIQTITVAEGNDSFCQDNNVLFSKDKKTLLLYPGGESAQEYTIPTGVERIGSGAFSGASNLISINIPYGVTVLESGCFRVCSSLEHVELPDSITEIEGFAFTGGIKSIHFPNNLKKLGEYAFQSCLFSEIELPEGLEEVESPLFYNCNNLQKVTIPNTLTSLPSGMFSHCLSLRSVFIPATVNSLSVSTFSDCPKVVITAITGSYAARFCEENNIPYITIPCTDHVMIVNPSIAPTMTTTGLTEGQYCSVCGETLVEQKLIPALCDMTVVYLPLSLTTIEEEAFSNLACQAIIISDGCTTIGEHAFANCQNLLYVHVPSSVTSIADDVFEDCNEDITIFRESE